MSQNRALIVDDSRTAQARLRKMLEKFDLQVDTVFSAEEAFGYLTYRQPAVVFMDHHMEGMDGLEALRVIKSNPDTALVPVIMYTSEQGDVYVGQARALGAIDILSKEVIKHASLEKVLASLGIGAANEQAGEAVAAEAEEPARLYTGNLAELRHGRGEAGDRYRGERASMPASEEALRSVQQQISRQFELHIASVRQEIEDSRAWLARRLTTELNRREPPQSAVTDLPPEPVVHEKSAASVWILGLILLVMGFAGYHLYINNQHQALARQQVAELNERVRAQETLINRLFDKISTSAETRQATQTYADRQVLLDALSWAVNVNNQIGFGEQPLSSERIYILGELVSLLKAANFSGTVYLDTHLGNYCVVEGPSGQWMLPEPESNLSDCVLLADIVPEVPVSEQMSIGFLNYMNSTPALTEGQIDIEIATHNYSAPQSSYPARTSATSAGQWNEVAKKNSRITLLFSAD